MDKRVESCLVRRLDSGSSPLTSTKWLELSEFQPFLLKFHQREHNEGAKYPVFAPRMVGRHNEGAKQPVFAPRMVVRHNEGAKHPVFAPRMGGRHNVGAKYPVFAPRMVSRYNGGAKHPVFAPRMVSSSFQKNGPALCSSLSQNIL